MNTRNIAKEYRMTHWAGIIRERNESGKSIKSFCESSGIPENVYYYWQRRLRESARQQILSGTHVQEAPGQAVVPSGWSVCAVTKSAESPVSVCGAGGAVTIEIGKSRVSANADTDIELLSNVCRMLMSLC